MKDDPTALWGSLVPGRSPALLLVDPVVAYVDPLSPFYAGSHPAGHLRRLLAAARAARIPVCITRVLHHKNGIDGGLFARKIPALKLLAADSPLGVYADGLEPVDDDVEITKQYPSAFAHTPLAATLTAMGADTVIIGGFSTSGCIRATATDAMQSGFVPLVAREAVGDCDLAAHRANLIDIQTKIGEVVTVGDIIGMLKGNP